MKNMATLLVFLLLAFQTQASEDVLAVARKGLSQEVAYDFHVYEVKLLASQELEVTKYRPAGHFGTQLEEKKVVTFPLHQHIYKQLAWMANSLKGEEIIHTSSLVVCELYVEPAAFFDDLKIGNKGEFETVLSPQGCWVTESYKAKNRVLFERSKLLKELLVTLGLQLIQG